jgi:signal transduction histidine kinase
MAHTPEKRLLVRTAQAPEFAVLAVSDTGVGIQPEAMPGLFTEKGDPSAGGFGLPYSEKVLGKYGGSIDVESAPGKGTTFTVRIPWWSPRTAEVGDEYEA